MSPRPLGAIPEAFCAADFWRRPTNRPAVDLAERKFHQLIEKTALAFFHAYKRVRCLVQLVSTGCFIADRY
jgi:hypothetical protein